MSDPLPRQLDIFADSLDTALRNKLIEALCARDAARAAAAWSALQAEFADDAALAPGAVLVRALADSDTRALADAEAVLAARRQITQELSPAARAVLGSTLATPWLAAAWSVLAARAKALPFQAERGEAHAAALFIEAAAWPAAQAAVATIESWRRIPQPLAWMAEARWHGDGPDAAWPLLVELAWLAPGRFAKLAPTLRGAGLARLLRGFEADEALCDGEASWAWFPAWALAEQAVLAPAMAGAEPGRGTAPERGWRLVNALLRAERRAADADRTDLRRQLQKLNPDLFAAYMKPRR